jgi:hypothetical protein
LVPVDSSDDAYRPERINRREIVKIDIFLFIEAPPLNKIVSDQ